MGGPSTHRRRNGGGGGGGGGGGKRGGGPPIVGTRYSPYSSRGEAGRATAPTPAPVKRPQVFAEILSFLPFSTGQRSAHEQLARTGKAATHQLAESVLSVQSFIDEVTSLPFLQPLQHTVNDKETIAAEEKGAAKVNPSLKPLNGVPGESETCYRALIVFNNPTSENSSILESLSLVCAKNSTGTDKNPFCYGGIVSRDDPLSGLQTLLQQQTGVDFSGVTWTKICEITHEKKDRSQSYTTTYVLPDLRQISDAAVFKSLAEEQAAVEAVEATETAEKIEAKPAITTRLVTPVTVPFLTLLGEGSAGITNKSLEVNTAFQILDEITMSVLLSEVSNFLSRRSDEAQAVTEYRNMLKSAEEKIINRVKELELQKSNEIAEDLKKLQAEWDDDDCGETEMEVEEKKPGRVAIKDKLLKETNAKYSELIESSKTGETGPQKEVTKDIDRDGVLAFQYFARVVEKGKPSTAGETFNAKTLINATLAAKCDGSISLKEARDTFIDVPRTLRIKDFCAIERVVDQQDVEMEDMEANDEPEPETTTTEAADQDQDVEMVASPGQADAAADKYSSMTYRELQVECTARSIPATGKKTDLLNRLREGDNA